jgi:hypothetical protein
MRILLQHRRTLHYLRNNNTWTKRAFDARNFHHSQAAIDFAYEHNLLEVYIAVKFLDGDGDVAAPLPARNQAVFA